MFSGFRPLALNYIKYRVTFVHNLPFSLLVLNFLFIICKYQHYIMQVHAYLNTLYLNGSHMLLQVNILEKIFKFSVSQVHLL